MKISIVVAARNEREHIEKCLSRMPSYPDLEVIVVDDASEDETSQIASRFPGVKVYRNDTPRGAAYTWDYGARKATGDLIHLLSAEAYVSNPESVIHYFNDPKVVQVIPRIRLEGEGIVPNVQKIRDKVNMYLHDVFFGTKISKTSQNIGLFTDDFKDIKITPWSHALMRKEFYLKVNPPLDRGVGEEGRFEKIATGIVEKEGLKLIYEKDFVYHWLMYTTVRRRFIQQRYYGRCLALNLNKPKHVLKMYPLLVPLSFPALFLSKWLALLLLVPTIVRFVIGLKVIKKGEVKYYPFFMLLTLIEHFVYAVGFIENIVYRITTGKYVIHR